MYLIMSVRICILNVTKSSIRLHVTYYSHIVPNTVFISMLCIYIYIYYSYICFYEDGTVHLTFLGILCYLSVV